MDSVELTASDLLGRLNEVEQLHAPKQLFAAGDIAMLRSAARVSIVGSRKASILGRQRARKLSSMLVRQGIVVVSGLAEGIDTAAHQAAVDAGGRTVAVLGTPLDKFYPRENEPLQRRLMEEQLVLSQFPTGTKTQRYHFPERNRTMALVSDATVIIEAGETSGSLSQGWEALRLGRMLFIAQSVVDDDSLKWPKTMLDYGAAILTDETVHQLIALLPDRAFAEAASAVSF